jgi:hypothetical protein
MKPIKYLLPIFIVCLMAQPAAAAFNEWSGSGPYATGLADRLIKAIAISSDGKTVYSGTGSATVFHYSYGYYLTVSIAPVDIGVGDGQVTSDTGGINCTSGGSGPCRVIYQEGTPVTLTATTAQDSTFDGWQSSLPEGCSGFAPCVLTMVSDTTVTAQFGLGPEGLGPVAKIASTGYNSLNDAYKAAGSSATIKLVSGAHPIGPLVMDLSKNIILKGGYNPFFSNLTGLPSILQGTLFIQNGSLRSSTVKLK